MNTPICDFVRDYAAKDPIRMHMPGHKGKAPDIPVRPEKMLRNGFDPNSESDPYEAAFSRIYSYDITEISDADDLFHPKGIISESEKNASEVFGVPTYYSTEGSSLCIRAMLALCKNKAAEKRTAEKREEPVSAPWVLAARNVHQTFVSACALLDLDAEWIGSSAHSFLSMDLDARSLEKALEAGRVRHGCLPVCVYVTSPDYTGHILPIREISQVCHEKGIFLLVDNAHGAYLHFLEKSLHPMDLGADLCCDSAHKTLPALTGCAYLHVKKGSFTEKEVKEAMSLFASTSPSWILLQSLDLLNPILSGVFRKRLSDTLKEVEEGKKKLSSSGILSFGEEPLKITIETRKLGYTGDAFAKCLRKGENSLEVEFSDAERVVLMVSPSHEISEIRNTFCKILSIPKISPLPEREAAEVLAEDGASEKKLSIDESGPGNENAFPEKVLSLKKAVFSEREEVPVKDSIGRIASLGRYGCPPAVPIVMPGERIGKDQAELLSFYGYETCQVVK